MVLNRHKRVLYYDCTNYYFEIEEADNFRKYGHSKENRPNDPKRFIRQNHCTSDGEIADKMIPSIDEDLATEEERYDGFYAVCTNLEDDVATIISINQKRWQIEKYFRIMKSEFQARPVYLSRIQKENKSS